MNDPVREEIAKRLAGKEQELAAAERSIANLQARLDAVDVTENDRLRAENSHLRGENATLQRRLEKVGLLQNAETWNQLERVIAELQRCKDGLHYEYLRVHPF